MCLCSLGNILDLGVEGTGQGGDVGAVETVVQNDVGAFCTVDQKDVVAFGTVDQNDVVAAGTVRKCWFGTGKESVAAVSHQSSVISPGLKVSDPMLAVGDGRCAANIPPPRMCRLTRARAYPGWCRSVRHEFLSRGEE